MSPSQGENEEVAADTIIAAMREASGSRLTDLGRQLADLLDREQARRDDEIDRLRRTAQSLDHAVAELMTATSGTDLLRRTCRALADICSAERVLAATVENDRAVPVATVESLGGATTPAAYRLLPESVEARVLETGAALATDQPAAELRDLFPSGCTVMVVTVDDTPTLILHVAGRLAAAQHDSTALLLQVAGSCLRRLGLSARRTQQLNLLRASGMARENHAETATAEPETLPSPPAPSWTEPLTERESEVLRLIVRGASNTAIATELVITVDTVKSHVKRILRKLGATNRSELIARHSAAALTRRPIEPPSR
ncbi:LuxR family transcriptional regulator [Nocardia nova]|uniref:LuxR family transcriptional regulator n=1 Tax=Nocardia nova TaxID=37330 RepID=A0A2S6AII6_9NOCA|nr:helix-turn-helix transcriptional regulator [Nocardia nova]PPJ23728.1 LuxR family transcriptional regulator [Nocardia nova]PPJ35046.1 LuxR family transcriptional regulator [Nocardia nova]